MKPVITAFLMSAMMFCSPQSGAGTAAGSTQTLTLETTLNNPTCTLSLSPTLGGGGNGSGVVAGSSVTYSMVRPSALKAAITTGGLVYQLPPLKLQLTCDAVTGGVSSAGKMTFTGTANNCDGNASNYLFCGAGTTSQGVGYVFKPGKTTVVLTGGAPDEAVTSGNVIDVLPKGSAITSAAGKVVKDIDVGVGISAAKADLSVVKAGHLNTTVNFDFAWK
ncbi:hypothetical protein [Escherichia coli]|uniref:hypothetical protein n=1 Tax=Escherichia coli TaxID=562 RepID=UPI001CDA562D|nr:hypothetical protein [Escherichia coli]